MSCYIPTGHCLVAKLLLKYLLSLFTWFCKLPLHWGFNSYTGHYPAVTRASLMISSQDFILTKQRASSQTTQTCTLELEARLGWKLDAILRFMNIVFKVLLGRTEFFICMSVKGSRFFAVPKLRSMDGVKTRRGYRSLMGITFW